MKLPVSYGFKWNQSSVEMLNKAESMLLSCLGSPYKAEYVAIGKDERESKIWTLKMNEHNRATPLLLVHGMGGGVALWVLNLDSMSQRRPVYAMDVLGFGKSSRSALSINPSVAEIEWVDSIEEWRQKLGVSKFHLLGHSLGGFLAASYALRYPENIEHLILVEPWGITGKPAHWDNRPRPLWVRAVTALVRQFDPLAGLRVAGPWGAGLIKRVRPDLGRRFSSPRAAAEVVYDYIHQCNIQSPATGESAFRTLSDAGWARNPILNRINRLPSHIPISCIYGARSWMDSKTGTMISEACKDSKVELHVLPQAGHHVYADQAQKFNDLVDQILLNHDQR